MFWISIVKKQSFGKAKILSTYGHRFWNGYAFFTWFSITLLSFLSPLWKNSRSVRQKYWVLPVTDFEMVMLFLHDFLLLCLVSYLHCKKTVVDKAKILSTFGYRFWNGYAFFTWFSITLPSFLSPLWKNSRSVRQKYWVLPVTDFEMVMLFLHDFLLLCLVSYLHCKKTVVDKAKILSTSGHRFWNGYAFFIWFSITLLSFLSPYLKTPAIINLEILLA